MMEKAKLEKCKEVVKKMLEFWRKKKEEGDEIAIYYVDAYACVLHNIEHIERGEIQEE